MNVERSAQPVSATRLASLTRSLLRASTLCAIATASTAGRPHVNTAYFAWSPELDHVWLTDPRARHSRNIRANGSVAIAFGQSNGCNALGVTQWSDNSVYLSQ